MTTQSTSDNDFLVYNDFFDGSNDDIHSMILDGSNRYIQKVSGNGLNIDNSILNSIANNNSIYIENGYLKNSPVLSNLYYFDENHIIRSINDVYDFFNKLVSEFPFYVNRVDRGVDALGNHIYEYAFTPPPKRVQGVAISYSLPTKITIMAGIHGSERAAIINLMIFCYNLCHNPNGLENYSKIRSSMQLIVVPAINPSGVNSRNRVNSNGVDLNRNFPTEWSNADGSKGDSPLSELESRIALDIFNAHPDSLCNLSLHGHGLEKQLFWMGSHKEWTLRLSNKVLNEVLAFYHDQMPFDTDKSLTLNYLSNNTAGTLDRHLQIGLNKSSILLEFSGVNELLGNNIVCSRVLGEVMLKKTIFEILETHQQSLILKSFTN